MKSPAVYIMASKSNTTVYIGLTSHLVQRVYQHKNHLIDGFTKKYNVDKLVYFELHENMLSAIQREKTLKKWNRPWKNELIETLNPEWKDLSGDLF